ncbi:MAG: carbonic anhydrase [Nitrososphaerota archaeon]
MNESFGTSICCMDGRIQTPVHQWLQTNYGVKYVDIITEPGIDKLFFDSAKVEEIKSKALISVKKHNSSIILVSGHFDCAGNPVSKEEHIRQIKNAVSVIKSWNLSAKVIGAWVNEDWKVIEV